MPSHHHLHRRQPHEADFDPFAAMASAAADAFSNANPFAQPPQTLVSFVTVTAAKTFDGPVGGYITMSGAKTTGSDAQATGAADNGDGSGDATESTAPHRASPTGLPPSIAAPKTTVPNSMAVVAATGAVSLAHVTPSPSLAGPTAAGASSTSAPVATAGGMSTAGKAGMAIGIMLLIGAALSLVLYAFKKKREARDHDRLDNEKDNMFGAAAREPSIRTNATAPRLSLRPVTQFLPNLGERRQSRGNALAMTGPQSERPRGWERPAQDPNNRNNPFGNHAEAMDANHAQGPSAREAAAAGAAAGAGVGLARGASKRGHGPQPIDFTNPSRGPPSPSGTEFSDTADSAVSPTQTKTGAAIAAAGGPPVTSVHRVQLDFKPSMDDELELRAGQLVRLLHEYDDGWALCIRLDRSQQGVAPRTCLSTRPVKPRPQHPAAGAGPGPRGPPPPGMRVPQGPMNQPLRPQQQGRPMSPAGQAGRPMTPNGGQQRPMTPNGGNGPQFQQRPMTPNGGPQRPMTPNGGQQQGQGQGRRMSPPMGAPGDAYQQGPQMGPVGRKPVPGQAL